MYRDISAAVMGSINMDIILKADRLPDVGENVLGSDYSYAFGGKGANQATGLVRLGARTKMIGKVGNDANGIRLLENLRNNNIDISGVATDGTSTGLAAILIDKDGRNRIIVYEGANTEIVPDDAKKYISDELDVLLVQFETNEEAVVSCVNEAVRKGIVTVVDCGPAKNFCLERMQGVTIITPNENETEALTGIFPADEKSILTASRMLFERSKARYVVLKLGERGSSVYDGERLEIFPSYPARVLDTTAAGDSFTAALALEYVKSGDIRAAAVMGNKAGAIAVSRVGADASMPTAEELINFATKK